MAEYVSIDDGYGIIGYGFKCDYCGKFNNSFVFGDDEELYCEYCGRINKLEPVESL